MHLPSFVSRLLCGALVFSGLASLPSLALAADNLVLNGGFETGAFTSWTEIGNTAFNGVQCPGTGLVPEGVCGAYFGPLGSLGGIQQSIATAVGSEYIVSFAFSGDGGDPGSFQVDFGGQTLLSMASPTTNGFQTFSFHAVAADASSLLKFQFRDDTGFQELDSVSVTAAVPEPATWLMLALGLGMLTLRRRSN